MVWPAPRGEGFGDVGASLCPRLCPFSRSELAAEAHAESAADYRYPSSLPVLYATYVYIDCCSPDVDGLCTVLQIRYIHRD